MHDDDVRSATVFSRPRSAGLGSRSKTNGMGFLPLTISVGYNPDPENDSFTKLQLKMDGKTKECECRAQMMHIYYSHHSC